MNMLKSSVLGVGSKQAGPLSGLLGALGGINPVAIAAGFGVGALTGALIGGVKGALEEEKQMGRLNAALEANVPLWDGSTDEVERATGAAMDLAFSDDEARDSMIKLITATGSVEESTRDMSLAMNIARGRNIDLSAATDIVIKANMGNVGALRRLGIELDKGATKTEILATLQERYAGQAENYAKSTAGKFESAQVKVNNTMEEFGHVAIETTAGLLSVGDALKGDTDASSDFLHAVGNLVPGISTLADEMDKLVEKATVTKFEFGKIGGELTKGAADGLRDGIPAIHDAADDVLHEMFMVDRRADAEAAAERFGNAFTDDLADSLRGNKDEVADAMDDLMYVINHPLQLEQELARIQGALTSAALAEGLASNNFAVRAAAQQTQERLKEQWKELTGEAYQVGVSAAQALERGLRTFKSPKFPINGPTRLHGADKGATEGYASGGDLEEGEVAWVGERGKELIQAGKGGAHVFSNPESTAMVRSAGGSAGPSRIDVHVNLSTREFAQHQKHYAVVQAGGSAF